MDLDATLRERKTAALLTRFRRALLDASRDQVDDTSLRLLIREIDGLLASGSGNGAGRLPRQKARSRTTKRELTTLGDGEERLALILQLEKATRAREEFLEIASHELRTPLTALRLQLQGLERKVADTRDASDEELERFVSRLASARRQTERLIALVSGLFEGSRLMSGPPPIRRIELDLSKLVVEICDRYREEASRRGCVLNVEVPAPVSGYWDPDLLSQLLSHLLVNALKYAPGAPVTVRVESAGDAVSLSVSDQGMGIPARRLSRIFDRFERVTSSRSQGGLGMGLFVARGIARAHGGDITAESRDGQGARFLVRLPLEVPQPAIANVTKNRKDDSKRRPGKRAKVSAGRKRAG